MTATVFRQSYMTQRPSLLALISYCDTVFSFAPLVANGWFTSCDGFYDASACWLSHMKQYTITIMKVLLGISFDMLFSELYKIMMNKVTFVGFRWGDVCPIASSWLGTWLYVQ